MHTIQISLPSGAGIHFIILCGTNLKIKIYAFICVKLETVTLV